MIRRFTRDVAAEARPSLIAYGWLVGLLLALLLCLVFGDALTGWAGLR